MSFFGFFGSPDIEKMKTKRDIKGLIKTLKHQQNKRSKLWKEYHNVVHQMQHGPREKRGRLKKSENSLEEEINNEMLVHEAVVSALGEIGDAQVIPLLINDFKDGDELRNWKAKIAVVEALAKIGSEQAIAPLDSLFEGQSEQIQEAIALAFGQIRHTSSVDVLVKRIDDLSKGGRGPYFSLVKSLGEIVKSLEESRDERTARTFVNLLGSNPGINEIAARSLSYFDSAIVVDALSDTLKSNRIATRLEAVRILGQIGGTKAIETLVGQLDSDRWEYCAKVAATLETVGWQPVNDTERALHSIAKKAWISAIRLNGLNQLIKLFTDEEVGDEIVDALSQLRTPEIIEKLRLTMLDGSGPNQTRQQSAKALWSMEWQSADPEAQAVLLALCGRWTELIPLGEVAAAPIERLLQADLISRIGGVKILGNIGNSRSISLILDYIGDAANHKILEERYYAQRLLPNNSTEMVTEGISSLKSILERDAINCPDNQLSRIVALEDIIHFHVIKPSCIGPDEHLEIDCSHVRQLARQELIRRGEKA